MEEMKNENGKEWGSALKIKSKNFMEDNQHFSFACFSTTRIATRLPIGKMKVGRRDL